MNKKFILGPHFFHECDNVIFYIKERMLLTIQVLIYKMIMLLTSILLKCYYLIYK
jgi:hypothetical protein